MSAKLIGDIRWEVQPDFPELSGKDGDETVTVRVTASQQGMAQLPLYGAPFISDDPFFSHFSYLKLTDRNVKLDRGRKTYNITLVYANPEDSEYNTGAVTKREVEYVTQDIDIPLAQHDDYRVHWNHVLLARAGTKSSPAWWKNAETKQITGDDANSYVWAKPDEKVPDGWYIVCPESKPGVEAYRSGICTVNVITRSTNKNYLARSAEKDYTIQTPPETFGRGGEWLRGGSQIRKTGRQWELQVSHLNAKKWDRDLYK